MYNNLRKTFKKVSTACFVLLLSTTTMADTIQEINTTKVNLCEQGSTTKCVQLSYEGEKLTIKKADGSSASLNIDNANFAKLNVYDDLSINYHPQGSWATVFWLFELMLDGKTQKLREIIDLSKQPKTK